MPRHSCRARGSWRQRSSTQGQCYARWRPRSIDRTEEHRDTWAANHSLDQVDRARFGAVLRVMQNHWVADHQLDAMDVPDVAIIWSFCPNDSDAHKRSSVPAALDRRWLVNHTEHKPQQPCPNAHQP